MGSVPSGVSNRRDSSPVTWIGWVCIPTKRPILFTIYIVTVEGNLLAVFLTRGHEGIRAGNKVEAWD
jgi:hypothetical protein